MKLAIAILAILGYASAGSPQLSVSALLGTKDPMRIICDTLRTRSAAQIRPAALISFLLASPTD